MTAISTIRINASARPYSTGCVLGLVSIWFSWTYVINPLVPMEQRISIRGLAKEAWLYRGNFYAYEHWRYSLLDTAHYPAYFVAVAFVGVFAYGATLAVAGRSFWPAVFAIAGAGVGAVLGFVSAQLLVSWDAIMLSLMPAAGTLIFGGLAARFTPLDAPNEVLRGATITVRRSNTRKVIAKAQKTGRVALAGMLLDRELETRHIAAVGVTGTGKSTALRQLMATALYRGDRHVVADPDGGAMASFFQPGDIILNPFDARSVKWDLLAEINEESDYRFLAESVLPFKGSHEGDVWISHSQQVFAGGLKTWRENALGDTKAFCEALAGARTEQLALLCKGTAAQRYFEAGGERMLSSILSTLAPAASILLQMSLCDGEAFSIRRWVREGKGTLWLPYRADQIAALRDMISCFMRIAIFKTLALEPSIERRTWFHVDELDALGPIAGLSDALSRMRKFGGCVVLGFQSIAQVRAVYGDAGAKTIIENCGSKLLLRCEDSEGGGTASFCSQLIGDREVARDEGSSSQTQGRHASSSRSVQIRRHIERVVMPSEISGLEDRQGYLKLGGHAGWFKVGFDYVGYPQVVSAFEARDVLVREIIDPQG